MSVLRCSLVVTAGVLATTGVVLAEMAPPVRFEALAIYVDSGRSPLAAWQIELEEADGRMTVVGVESGDHAAFAQAPHYDRDAVAAGQAERLVVAAFSLAPAETLPTGRVRVATVHVRLEGQPAAQYRLWLVAAGNGAGKPIDATASVQQP